MVHEQWERVSKHRRCPVCDHDHWCLICRDGSACICPRVESGRRAGEAGYLHRLTGAPAARVRTNPVAIVRSLGADYSTFAMECQAAAERAGAIDHAARQLGVTAGSFRRLGVGWWAGRDCWTWPMTDSCGRRVIGITRRFLDGSKRCMRGHRAGLYLPHDLPADMSRSTMLIVEGGSDAAVGLDLGYWSVGRFSCQHGGVLLRRLLMHRCPALIVVCADRGNVHERQGGEALARDLLPFAQELRLIAPPAPHRDLRAWRKSGATHGDLAELIESTSRLRVKVRVR